MLGANLGRAGGGKAPRTGITGLAGALSGLAWGAVAVQDFGAVGAAGGGGTVWVQCYCPAPLVDGYVVVKEAVQGTAVHAGRAAVGQVGDMMYLTGRGGLVAAAGPPAVLVPQDHRAADRGRDLRAVPDVQRQRRPGQPGAEQTGAQERGQPVGAGDQVDGLADDRVPEHLQGLRRRRPRTGVTGAVGAGQVLGRDRVAGWAGG